MTWTQPASDGRPLLSHLTFLTLLWMVCGFTEGLSFFWFSRVCWEQTRGLPLHMLKKIKMKKKYSTATEQAGLMRALGLVGKTRAWQGSASKLPLPVTVQDASDGSCDPGQSPAAPFVHLLPCKLDTLSHSEKSHKYSQGVVVGRPWAIAGVGS